MRARELLPPASDWGWFAAWSLVGAGYVVGILGALTIGPFVMPLPVIGTVLLVLRPRSLRAAPGLIAGPVWILSFIAFRDHGTSPVCTGTLGGGSCSYQPWNRWPWTCAAVGFLVIAVVVFVLTQRRARMHELALDAQWRAYWEAQQQPPWGGRQPLG